jgi:hypothetical protein
MSNDYSPDADDQVPEKKSSQQLLLLLLLLLILVFVYLYFFTGLIKPRGEEPKPPPVAEAPVKQPLPPRPGAAPAQPQTAKQGTPAAPQGAPAKPGATPAAQQPAPAKEAAAGKTAAPAKEAPAAKPASVAGAKPVAPAPQAKPAAAPAPAKGAQPAAVAAKEAAPAPGSAKKAATQPGAAAKTAQKQPAGEKAAAGAKAAAAGKTAEKTAAAGAKPQAPAIAAAPAYTLVVEGELADSELASALAKLKQAGVTHVVQSKVHKGEPMHRLFLADFANRDEALEELERLKLAAPDAFLLKEGGRYAVYAGSYLRDAKAASEQTRLQGKGVQLLLKEATAPVNVHRVSAGAFANQAGADKAAKALKKAGLSVKVVKLAKARK